MSNIDKNIVENSSVEESSNVEEKLDIITHIFRKPVKFKEVKRC